MEALTLQLAGIIGTVATFALIVWTINALSTGKGIFARWAVKGEEFLSDKIETSKVEGHIERRTMALDYLKEFNKQVENFGSTSTEVDKQIDDILEKAVGKKK